MVIVSLIHPPGASFGAQGKMKYREGVRGVAVAQSAALQCAADSAPHRGPRWPELHVVDA